MNHHTKYRVAGCLALLGAVLISSHSWAHHSFAATFKQDEIIEVEGIVTEFSFRNPHVLVYMDVTDADGSVTNWMSEGAAATLLRRNGWSRDSLSVGDAIRVTGNSTHDGSPMVSIEDIELLSAIGGRVVGHLSPNGEQRQAADNNPQRAEDMPLELADGIPNLTGTWTNHGVAGQRPGPPTLTFTAAGQALQDSFDLANDPQVFCDQPGLARQAGTTPHPVKITQYDDRVVFDYEEYGGHREVYFDNSHHKGYHTLYGDSIARYEDGALIIETTNLLSATMSPEGHQHSDQATAIETYRRADTEQYGPMVQFETRVTDPVTLVGEAVMQKLKMNAGDYEMIENACETPMRERDVVHPAMSFFLTSEGVGDGANLGGLAGADAHCTALADRVGQGDKNWKAYLSTTGENSVDARDRIGQGPWYNARGIPIAESLADLHGEAPLFTKATVLTERGATVMGRGDEVNRHDILTGSTMNGTASEASEGDTTCNNWTSNGEGSALVGHFDRTGGGQNPTSLNSAHGSRGCSQENLQGTGGDGLFYCFAVDQ